MSHGDCMRNNNLLDRFVISEEKASKHINVLTHYDDETLLDKSGKLIKIIKLSGLDFITKDEKNLDAFKRRRNNLLKSFSSELAFYYWEVKRKDNQYPSGEFQDGYAKQVNDKYQQQIKKAEMFHTELYLAVMTKHPEGFFNKSYSVFQHLNAAFDKEAKQVYLMKCHKELNDATRKIISNLADYKCEVLSIYEKNEVKFSAPLTFLSKLINFDSFPVPLAITDAARTLPRKRLFFNSKAGSVELRAADGSKKFAAMLSIKAYALSRIKEF